MRNNVPAGVVAGLIAGFGIMMQMMNAPTPDGREVPMMMMVTQVVKSDSLAIGWLYHLFNSAVIGGSLMGHLIFGLLLGIAFAWLRRRAIDRGLTTAGSAR